MMYNFKYTRYNSLHLMHNENDLFVTRKIIVITRILCHHKANETDGPWT